MVNREEKGKQMRKIMTGGGGRKRKRGKRRKRQTDRGREGRERE